MPGLKRWIQPCPVIDVSIALVIHSPLEIDTLFQQCIGLIQIGCAEGRRRTKCDQRLVAVRYSLALQDCCESRYISRSGCVSA